MHSIVRHSQYTISTGWTRVRTDGRALQTLPPTHPDWVFTNSSFVEAPHIQLGLQNSSAAGGSAAVAYEGRAYFASSGGQHTLVNE